MELADKFRLAGFLITLSGWVKNGNFDTREDVMERLKAWIEGEKISEKFQEKA